MTCDNFFYIIMPYCNTNRTNIFLEELAKQYLQDQILLICNGTTWHKPKALKVHGNNMLLGIPPFTPEMNPREQFWK